MSAPYLLLAPGALGALALPIRFLPARARTWSLGILCGAGGALAIATAALAPLDAWRTTGVHGPEIVVASASAFVMWVVTATLVTLERRPAWAAATGLAASGLLLASTGEWLVPSILFWICASAAVAVAAARCAWQGRVWVAVFVGDALVVTAAAGAYFSSDGWASNAPLDGAAYWLVVAAALVRIVGAALAATHASMTTALAPVAPFLVGSAFALLAAFGGRSEPWLGAAALTASLAIGLAHVVRPRVGLEALTVSLALFGVACVDAGFIAPLGAVACLAVAARATVLSAGMGSIAVVVIGLMPPAASLLWLDAAVKGALGEMAAAATPAAAAPWSVVGVTCVLVLLLAPVVAGRVTTHGAKSPQKATVAVGALIGAATIAFTAGVRVAVEDANVWRVDVPVDRWPLAAALGAALLAALVARRRRQGRRFVAPEAGVESEHLFHGRVEAIVGYAALVVGIAALLGALALTFFGLKIGFL